MKNFFKLFGLIAIVAIIGIGLAGCPTEEEDPDITGTIKLTGTGTNSFTLTLEGGPKWIEGSFEDFEVSSYVELDGPVTDAEFAGDPIPASIDDATDISYTVVRTSDTVLTVTMSKYWGYDGAGKVKLSETGLDVNFSRYIQGSGVNGSNIHITIAADSGSASFYINP
ncbi:hypothetical protein FACS189485_09380 [Spirochaetia bacterium]|nr:hypothetical protein FACS189485_09380 [Spirochaetia bacterium]